MRYIGCSKYKFRNDIELSVEQINDILEEIIEHKDIDKNIKFIDYISTLKTRNTELNNENDILVSDVEFYKDKLEEIANNIRDLDL